MKYESVAFQSEDETLKAYESGRCDAFTTDASGLYAERLRLTNPDEHMVLPEIISKEPLAPSVRQGDDQWFDIMRWTGFALINAEELGVTSKNVDDMMKSDNPNIRRLLGVEGDQGKALGAVQRLGLQDHQAGRQLRRDLRPQRRRGLCRSRSSAA